MGDAKMGGPERAIRWTMALSVIALLVIAAIVSYKRREPPLSHQRLAG